MLRTAFVCSVLLTLTCVQAQEGTEVDIDEMTNEEIENLSPDILERLPAKEMMVRVFSMSPEFELPERAATYMLQLALRDLYYAAPIESVDEQDHRDAVRAFQENIGEEPTGVLTFGEYTTLIRMAQRRRDTPVYASPSMFVYVEDDFASAQGTWIIEGDQIAYPVNTSKIECLRSDRSCMVTQADVTIPSLDDDDTGYYLGLSVNHYEVISWTDSEVIARAVGGTRNCRTTLLTLNGESEEVYEITRNANQDDCGSEDDLLSLPPLESPRISRLVDGYDVTSEYWREREKETAEYINPELQDSEIATLLEGIGEQ